MINELQKRIEELEKRKCKWLYEPELKILKEWAKDREEILQKIEDWIIKYKLSGLIIEDLKKELLK